MTAALNSEELRPPYIPYALLQHLCQAPAFIGQLRAEMEGGGAAVAARDAQGPALGGGMHWTARLRGAVDDGVPRGAASSSSSAAAAEGLSCAL